MTTPQLVVPPSRHHFCQHVENGLKHCGDLGSAQPCWGCHHYELLEKDKWVQHCPDFGGHAQLGAGDAKNLLDDGKRERYIENKISKNMPSHPFKSLMVECITKAWSTRSRKSDECREWLREDDRTKMFMAEHQGRNLRAKQDIAKDEIVYQEDIALMLPAEDKAFRECLPHFVMLLPMERHRSILLLSNVHTQDKGYFQARFPSSPRAKLFDLIEGIFATNSFLGYGCKLLFLRTSLINHGKHGHDPPNNVEVCGPRHSDESQKYEIKWRVQAVEEIKAGEALYIDYNIHRNQEEIARQYRFGA